MIGPVPGSEPRLFGERHRAESFGSVAQQYDRYRPSYPIELVDDLVALGPSDVLDVGCGTGKAARLLAERGLRVLGVEVDPLMASVARSHGIEVEIDGFESWDPAGRRFDLLTCAQAWHWVDPHAGIPKAATVLRPGGTIALFWNRSWLSGDVKDELDGVYRYRAPDLLKPSESQEDEPPYVADLARSGLFERPFSRWYPWQATYTTEQWVQLVQTHSDHLVLDAKRRVALIQDVADVIDAHGGTVTAEYSTYALFAHVPSP